MTLCPARTNQMLGFIFPPSLFLLILSLGNLQLLCLISADQRVNLRDDVISFF